ncbi:type I restriction endonuclease [Nostoc sp. 'Peltigera membranacea cyanobiont' N6]|uniref:type I restriction endonuclease n=1 Tax=Nostoc sp. 'Peltigera membranacea cyanobiont' N6 TaxID=1261031 RepID=UPI002157BADA|nr:type I restriction endonuclease [Nostoc sp. 'Peltigera membranacea cyanobiont' N6]
MSPVYYALYLRNKEKTSIDFYSYIFSNSTFQKYLFQYGKGILVKKSDSGKLNTIRMKISMQDLKKVPLPLPPIAEQKRIVEFLDHKTSEIDQAIAKKQCLIKLLQEQKTILINQAVTKGLNLKAPMRDSGVEWIGEVPEHWEVSRIGFIGEVGNGSTPNRSNAAYWESGSIPWLNSSKVNDGVIYYAEQFVTKRAVDECHLAHSATKNYHRKNTRIKSNVFPMVSKTNEQALENCIKTALVEHAGYQEGNPADFDREFAIDREKFWRFLETTQPEELAKLKDRPNWQRLILERCDRKIKKDGILSVLKKGLSIDDAHLTLLYSLPYNDTNPGVLENFEKNIFSITCQVHYSESDAGLSIDIVLFLNGLAIATMELKKPWTGQSVYHAKKQYREDRNPQEPLLQFSRCLVHFAVDTDEVWMTTKLDHEKTYFLPFNKGFNFGKGNPPNPNGHKSAYLWEGILTRQSFTNIIEHFAILIPGDTKTPLAQKNLYFPRYHQLDVVRQLLTDARTRGTGHPDFSQVRKKHLG